MTAYKVVDMCTGYSYKVTSVRETKCYLVVYACTCVGNPSALEHRFHKRTMCIDWLHLLLIEIN